VTVWERRFSKKTTWVTQIGHMGEIPWTFDGRTGWPRPETPVIPGSLQMDR